MLKGPEWSDAVSKAFFFLSWLKLRGNKLIRASFEGDNKEMQGYGISARYGQLAASVKCVHADIKWLILAVAIKLVYCISCRLFTPRCSSFGISSCCRNEVFSCSVQLLHGYCNHKLWINYLHIFIYFKISSLRVSRLGWPKKKKNKWTSSCVENPQTRWTRSKPLEPADSDELAASPSPYSIQRSCWQYVAAQTTWGTSSRNNKHCRGKSVPKQVQRRPLFPPPSLTSPHITHRCFPSKAPTNLSTLSM